MSINIKGVIFQEGEEITYTTIGGEELDLIVISRSEDDPNGLIVQNKNNQRRFAIGEKAVLTRVRKKGEAQPNVETLEQDSDSDESDSADDSPSPSHSSSGGSGSGHSSSSHSSSHSSGGFGWGKRFFSRSSNSVKSVFSRKITGLRFEILVLFALLIHAIDAFVWNFSKDLPYIGYRFVAYLLLSFIAYLCFQDEDFIGAMKHYMKISMIPLLFIPLLAFIPIFFPSADNIIKIISYVLLFVPVWLLYLLYIREVGIVESPNFKSWLLNLFRPSKLVRIWFAILIIVGIIWLLNTFGVIDSVRYGLSGSGPSPEGLPIPSPGEAVAGIGTFIGDTIKGVSESIVGKKQIIRGKYEELYNQTFGTYYTGEVEKNKELTGIFITEFQAQGQYYEGVPISLFGVVKVRSFSQNITMNTKCYAVDTRNTTRIIPGVTKPSRIENMFSEDYRGIICDFPAGSFTKGDYNAFLVLDFNFETWAYSRLDFMDREFVSLLRANREDIHQKYDVPLYTRTVYTNGPVMLGMNDRMELPLSLSTKENTYFPVGLTIDNRQQTGVRGEIKKLNKLYFRLPKQITLESCTVNQGIPRSDNIPGYHIYEFNVNAENIKEFYSLGCNAVVSPNNALSLLKDLTSKAVVSIVGTAEYDYTLSRQTTLRILELRR